MDQVPPTLDPFDPCGLNISVSDILENFASPDQKLRKIDLADFLIESREEEKAEPEPTTPNSKLLTPNYNDPVMQDLIDTFDLVPVCNCVTS